MSKVRCCLCLVLTSCIALTDAAFVSPSLTRHSHRMRFEQMNVSLATALAYGKTGGELIETVEGFLEKVLCTTDNETDSSTKPILAFFTAPWCGPCRLTNPVIKDIMKQFPNEIDVVEICTDDLPDVASDAGVESIPTIQLYYKGEVKDTIVGCVAKNILASAVNKVLEDIQ